MEIKWIQFFKAKISVIRVSKRYYPQTLLEKCKHETKKTKMENLINDDIEWSLSDVETDSESDNEADIGSDIGSDNE